VLTLAVDFLFLDRPASPRNILAVTVSGVAMVAYATVRVLEPVRPRVASAAIFGTYAVALVATAVWQGLPKEEL
jgi:hypothetical protein